MSDGISKAPLIGFILLAQITVSILGGIVFFDTPAVGEIRYGVSVNDIDLSGLTVEEGLSKLQGSFSEDLSAKTLQFTFEGKSWPLGYSVIDAKYNFAATLEEVQRVNSPEGFVRQRLQNFVVARKGLNVPLVVQYDEKKLQAYLEKLAAEIYQPSISAGIRLVNEELTVTSGTYGRKLNLAATSQIAAKAVTATEAAEIALVVDEIAPDISAEELHNIKEPVSVSVTVFNLADTNRVQNIINAAKAVDGIVVKSGAEFSFNSQTGPRVYENGYLKAPVIKNKVLALDIGGGVCQVATTLYQAVLHAGLEVAERSPHSIPPAYVPLGQDAVVAENSLDFRFINSLENPIYINSKVDQNKLVIRLFGKKENQFEVKLSTEEIREIKPKVKVLEDPGLFQGTSKIITEGRSGFSAKVYRSFLEKGQVVKRELISQDYYRPSETVMVTGTKENNANDK